MSNPKKYKFHFNWILSNRLAIGTSPLEEDNVNFLVDKGIKNIIGLCSDDEVDWHIQVESIFKTKRIILPDSHTDQLPTFVQLQKAFHALEEFIKDDITFIHCVASIERSPMLCILYVMKKYNITLENSLDYVKRMHKYTNPTNSQLKILNKFANELIN